SIATARAASLCSTAAPSSPTSADRVACSRDNDLRKPRFLDLDRYPAMTFAADGITASPAGWQVTGTLAVRGTSVRLAGDAAASSQDGSATVTAHTRLDRRALGIRAPGIMIGHTIDITVTAALRLTTQQ
ncbi:MAG: YceI family protein, partial [Trebonia sp.]